VFIYGINGHEFDFGENGIYFTISRMDFRAGGSFLRDKTTGA
jgi:hypothetical protein